MATFQERQLFAYENLRALSVPKDYARAIVKAYGWATAHQRQPRYPPREIILRKKLEHLLSRALLQIKYEAIFCVEDILRHENVTVLRNITNVQKSILVMQASHLLATDRQNQNIYWVYLIFKPLR